MPEWFDGVAQELSLISAAPVSFAIALVVVIIVVWAILHWLYHRMLSSKDIQIEVCKVGLPTTAMYWKARRRVRLRTK
jgi:low affinity Fe/Cu permease